MKKYLLISFLCLLGICIKAEVEIEGLDMLGEDVASIVKEPKPSESNGNGKVESTKPTNKPPVKQPSKPITKPTIKPPTRPSTPSRGRCQGSVWGVVINVKTLRTEAEANQLVANLRREFPGLRLEKSFLRPEWRVFVGDYFSAQSAADDLRKVRAKYSTATTMRWRIYCNRAK